MPEELSVDKLTKKSQPPSADHHPAHANGLKLRGALFAYPKKSTRILPGENAGSKCQLRGSTVWRGARPPQKFNPFENEWGSRNVPMARHPKERKAYT